VSREHIIEVENLERRFGELRAVDGVSFWVERGEIFGFLGPNGAGKTTTINILCTLLRPTAGHASVCGLDVTRQRSQVRQCIGLVFQDPSLDERLTALENLRFHAFTYNIPAAEREGRIEHMLRLMELWERRNSMVRTFSGGMKRRLEIARGLLHHPEVLFLDEPTLGLDPQTRKHIWDYVLKLHQEENITTFLTTHYMDEAEHATRIAIIDYGRIVAVDSPESLKRLVGGDIVHLQTEDNEHAQQEVRSHFQIEAQQDGQGLTFEVPQGDRFIPGLVNRLNTRILSVSVRRPTLDDVFIKLTGRELRDETMGSLDMLRGEMRHWRPRR
jgi:ABC-2 type transport system ATP-binding protein